MRIRAFLQRSPGLAPERQLLTSFYAKLLASLPVLTYIRRPFSRSRDSFALSRLRLLSGRDSLSEVSSEPEEKKFERPLKICLLAKWILLESALPRRR